jgi:DHA1 family bicyclomycin/chloramphenicol resistance-like MFS transporter
MTQAPQTLSDKQMAALLAMLVAIMPFSVDAYLPAIPAMAELWVRISTASSRV